MKKMNRQPNSNGFRYFVSEGVKNIFLHGFSSFAAVGVIAACLLITGSFTLVAYNLDIMITEIEDQSEIRVFIDETLTEEQARDLGPVIMREAPNVSQVIFVSKDEALEEYRISLGKDADILNSLEVNPLRHGFRIQMQDITKHRETLADIAKIPQIAQTNSRLDISEKLVQIRTVINAISLALVLMLGIVSIFIISNTIKLATFARREEIAVMKMVGATNGFIRWPFVFEGIALGEAAALCAYFLQMAFYNYMGRVVSGINIISIAEFSAIQSNVLIMFLLIGLIVGVGGSILSIRRFLRV